MAVGIVNMCVIMLNREDKTTSQFKDDLDLFNRCTNMLHNCDDLSIDLKATYHGFSTKCNLDADKMKEMENKIERANKWEVGKHVAAVTGGVALVAGAVVAAPIIAGGAAAAGATEAVVGVGAAIGGAIGDATGVALGSGIAANSLFGTAVAAGTTLTGAVVTVTAKTVESSFGLGEYAIDKRKQKIKKGK